MSETLAINSTISHYRITKKIGAGMGEVYRPAPIALVVRRRGSRSAALPKRVIRVTGNIQYPIQSRGYSEGG